MNTFSADDFTPCEVLENLCEKDKSCEIVGYIDKCPERKMLKSSFSSSNYFSRILLYNCSGKKIQVIGWGKEADKLEEIVKESCAVLELKRVVPKVEHRSYCNYGDYSCELVIKDWTSIKVIGKFSEIQNAPASAQSVSIRNLRSANGLVEVKGFLKTQFMEDEHNGKLFCVGAITDGIYKLEIQISHYNSYDCNEYMKGAFLQITGVPTIVQLTRRIYLQVASMENVKFIKGKKMDFENTIRGFKGIP